MKNQTATTVKIEKDLYNSFKILGIQNDFTLQTFAEKCIHLYVEQPSFRSIVNNFNLPIEEKEELIKTNSFGLLQK